MSEDFLALFRKAGALLDGHFILRSGLHSRQYFQCAILLQHTDIAAQVCGQLADKLRTFDCDTVISPALGGIVSAVGVIVDRSGNQKPNFGCRFISLIEIEMETFEPDKLPADLARIPAVKPGSK